MLIQEKFDLMDWASYGEERRSEGKAEGFAEGKAEGKEEGKVEEALDTAKRMLSKGKLSVEEIAEYSDLPIDKVKELADSMTA